MDLLAAEIPRVIDPRRSAYHDDFAGPPILKSLHSGEELGRDRYPSVRKNRHGAEWNDRKKAHVSSAETSEGEAGRTRPSRRFLN